MEAKKAKAGKAPTKKADLTAGELKRLHAELLDAINHNAPLVWTGTRQERRYAYRECHHAAELLRGIELIAARYRIKLPASSLERRCNEAAHYEQPDTVGPIARPVTDPKIL